jgi:hypothetical protein
MLDPAAVDERLKLRRNGRVEPRQQHKCPAGHRGEAREVVELRRQCESTDVLHLDQLVISKDVGDAETSAAAQ